MTPKKTYQQLQDQVELEKFAKKEREQSDKLYAIKLISDGTILPSFGNTAWVSLGGITFRAEL